MTTSHNTGHQSKGRNADVAELAAARADGATVLDVREPFEYERGHVPGARLVPMDQLGSLLNEPVPTETVYVICESGNRSERAAAWLSAAGWDARSVSGGTQAWRSAGFPVVSGPHSDAA